MAAVLEKRTLTELYELRLHLDNLINEREKKLESEKPVPPTTDLYEMVQSGLDLKQIGGFVYDLWGNGLTYRDKDLLQFYVDNFSKIISGCVDSQEEQENCQESYLGYIPSEDRFISGWDGYGMISFKIVDDSVENIDIELIPFPGGDQSEEEYPCVYPKLYDGVHRKYKDMVDIRLD